MATKIKETPVLRGKDAERFIESISKVAKTAKEVSERMQRNYERLSSRVKEI